jgi:inositol-hexakisphosphate kinase
MSHFRVFSSEFASIFFQVYQANTSRYICHDKYYGRQLTVQGFDQALYQFMHNGAHLRKDMIDHITLRIERLQQILRKQETFRFYSSSLLIMYDGCEEAANMSTESSSARWNHESSKSSPLQTSLVYSNANYTSSTGTCGHSEETTAEVGTWNTSNDHIETVNALIKPRVDVRMIDFAHSTHEGFCHDDQLHYGPDEGYLFGLESLLSAFCRIRDGVITCEDMA